MIFVFSCTSLFFISCSKESSEEDSIVFEKDISSRSVATIEDLVKDIEHDLNLTYANPAVPHDAFDVSTSSFIVLLEPNKSISTTNVNHANSTALSLVECQFDCHHFANKNPTYFDVKLVNTSNDTAYLEVSTGIGNQVSAPANLPQKVFMPGEGENASGINVCLSEVTDFSLELGAAPKIAEYLTYNVRINQILASDEYYTNINNYIFNGAVFPGDFDHTPGDFFGWNDGTPNDLITDFNSFKFQCDVTSYPACSNYFLPSGVTNQFLNTFCLEYDELNFYLDKETTIAKDCASFYNSDLLNFTSYYNAFANKGFWIADETYGRKVTRTTPSVNLNSPSNGCSCN